MKRRLLVVAVVLALAAAVFVRLQTRGQDADAARADRALSVKTVPVVVRDFPRVIEVPGTLEAAQQVAVAAQVSGTVLRQHAQEGDAVRAGQLLFTLDARPAEARMAQSRASLAGAQAETTDAARKLERLQPLQKSGYISQQEYDDAVVAHEAARARANTARAELQAAQLDAQYARIRAPIAGRVGRIDVRPGTLVQAGGDALTTVLASDALDVRASVSQEDWPALAQARAQGPVKATVFPAVGSTLQAEGTLVFVDAQIDATTGAVPIKVRLNTAPPALLPGQAVRTRLLLGMEPNATVVPEAALQHGQQGSYVYVVRGGKAEIQPVRQVRGLEGQYVVEGALRAGEPVLVEIPQRLKAGGKVRLEGKGATGRASQQ